MQHLSLEGLVSKFRATSECFLNSEGLFLGQHPVYLQGVYLRMNPLIL